MKKYKRDSIQKIIEGYSDYIRNDTKTTSSYRVVQILRHDGKKQIVLEGHPNFFWDKQDAMKVLTKV